MRPGEAEAARLEAHASGLGVSAKAIVLEHGAVLLLRNHRGEWELPGGRPEEGEPLVDAVVREVREETALAVRVERFVDSWDYWIEPEQVTVRVLSFVATRDSHDAAALGDEHTELGWQPVRSVPALNMPDGYKRSIALASTG